MSFFDWRVVPGFEIRLNKGTPNFTVVKSELVRSWSRKFSMQVKVSDLKSMFRLKLKRAWRAFCRRWSSESVKFQMEEMQVPR